MQNWLFSSGHCEWAHDFDERQRADFRRGPVRAYLEETPVFPGIWLYRGEAVGRSRFNMEVEAGTGTKGRLILGSMLAGRAMTLRPMMAGGPLPCGWRRKRWTCWGAMASCPTWCAMCWKAGWTTWRTWRRFPDPCGRSATCC